MQMSPPAAEIFKLIGEYLSLMNNPKECVEVIICWDEECLIVSMCFLNEEVPELAKLMSSLQTVQLAKLLLYYLIL